MSIEKSDWSKPVAVDPVAPSADLVAFGKRIAEVVGAKRTRCGWSIDVGHSQFCAFSYIAISRNELVERLAYAGSLGVNTHSSKPNEYA
jgi:hypothetical protein